MITFKPRGVPVYSCVIYTDVYGVDHVRLTSRTIRMQDATGILQEMVQLKYLTYEEAVRIEDMIHSDDEENLTVAEEIIYQKIK